MMTGRPIPPVHPPWRRTFRRSSGGRKRSCWRVRRPSRPATGLPARPPVAPSLVVHVVWFGAWVTVNAGAVRGIRPFDPFPFPFLTMTVSLEAVFLALFVLASQNRLSRQADKRRHLDLQIDPLAEREMTAVLQLLQDIARHLEVQTTVTAEQLEDLMKKTDLPPNGSDGRVSRARQCGRVINRCFRSAVIECGKIRDRRDGGVSRILAQLIKQWSNTTLDLRSSDRLLQRSPYRYF